MVTNSGGGYSRWNDIDLTRWRCDPTLDNWGSYVYIRDLKSNAVWGRLPSARLPVAPRTRGFAQFFRGPGRISAQSLRHRDRSGN